MLMLNNNEEAQANVKCFLSGPVLRGTAGGPTSGTEPIRPEREPRGASVPY